MILGSWQLGLAMQIVVTAAPVAVYFLILGLLNSQSRPQVLSARRDFVLLLSAISPLWAVPLLNWLGINLVTLSATILGGMAVIALLAPRPSGSWVIYNVTKRRVLRSADLAMRAAGLDYHRQKDDFVLESGGRIHFSALPLLRNVSVTIRDAANEAQPALRRFEAELTRKMRRIEVTPSPMAVSFVLIATAVIVAPLILMVDRMPEMVRIIGEMIN